jgi:colanic acid/amylovoran biosynthesis glycosyltransferase
VFPRYSETFILNELLAHERAGQAVEVFSLRAPGDGRFHEALGELRAPVTYVPSTTRDHGLWETIRGTASGLPDTWAALRDAEAADARDVSQGLWLAQAARRRGIRHLHAHFANAAGVVSRLAARAAGLSYSVTAHAKDIFHQDVDSGALRAMLDDARAAITVSDFNAAHLASLAPTAALHRVYNGIDLARYPYREPGDRPARVVAVGRLVEKKGFSVLVDACASLAASGRSLRCDVIGDGDQREALEARVAAYGLQGRVRLLGQLSQHEVRAAIAGAAVLAAPCIVGADGNRDGLPTVLIEAMALGTPCVATPVTGVPEAVTHDVTGMLVPERDPVSLAAALARLLDDAPLRVRLARAARARAESRFDADRNAGRLRRLAWAGAPAASTACETPLASVS